jgi:hypothetical protein
MLLYYKLSKPIKNITHVVKEAIKTDNLLFIVLIAVIIDALLEKILSISNKTITGV